MNPKVKKDLYVRTPGDEKVVYDKENGRVHFMNRTATFVFELCDGTHSKEEIIEDLLDIYDVSRDKAEKDVNKILKDMADNRIRNSSATKALRHPSTICRTYGVNKEGI